MLPPKLRRVASLLRPRVSRLQRELDESRSATQTWKNRAEKQAAKVAELATRRRELEEKLRELRARDETRRHSSLTPEVLGHLLRVRARHRPVLAADAAPASAREARLRAASAAYRECVDSGCEGATLERVDIGGVPWWVPCDIRFPDRVERLRRQAFPLRVLVQTREVALGGVMLDLGANIGRTSITRVLLGDVRAVYAAEPEPINYACLVRNILEHGLNGDVLPDRVAISATRGEMQMRRSPYVGGHRVLYSATRKPVETLTVPVWPLDEWIQHVGVEPASISFIKVDTQGSEVCVLRGASSLLARPHIAWQVEVDPALLRGAGTSVSELLSLFATHFTHFIDMGSGVTGPRVRHMHEAPDALAYVGDRCARTDLLLYQTV